MARYIDAEQFVEDLLKEMDAILNDDGKVIWSDHVCIGQDAQDIIDLVNKQPTADVVEVVRCKDCIYYKESELLTPNKFCYRLMHPTEDRHIGYNFADDDFCSYGKKVE